MTSSVYCIKYCDDQLRLRFWLVSCMQAQMRTLPFLLFFIRDAHVLSSLVNPTQCRVWTLLKLHCILHGTVTWHWQWKNTDSLLFLTWLDSFAYKFHASFATHYVSPYMMNRWIDTAKMLYPYHMSSIQCSQSKGLSTLHASSRPMSGVLPFALHCQWPMDLLCNGINDYADILNVQQVTWQWQFSFVMGICLSTSDRWLERMLSWWTFPFGLFRLCQLLVEA